MGTRNNIKYSVLEEDGVDYAIPHERIPDAQDIAFSGESFDSDNVKDGILEAKSDAIATAGFAVLGYTTTTSGPGKYLNIFGTTSSDILPYPILSEVTLIEAGLRSRTAATTSIGIYKLVNEVETLIYILSLDNEKRSNYPDLTIYVNPDEDILMKVISGSSNKPAVELVFRRGHIL